jgi:acetyl esterase/lipase
MNENAIRTGKDNVKVLIKIFMFLIFFALIGVAIWSLTGLYEENSVWWGGNSAVRTTVYTIYGPIIGVIGILLLLQGIAKKRKIVQRIQVMFVIYATIVFCLCIPYFLIPIQVRNNANQEFALTWGNEWEDHIIRPSQGSWLNQPYSLGVQYAGLPYEDSSFTIESNVVFLTLGSDSFKCDVFSPLGSGPFPILICIHGGGWWAGDKEPLQDQREYFAAQGYVVFSIQYGAHYGIHSGAPAETGISRQYSMQEIMNNIANFTNWLAKPEISSQYHLDLTRTFVTGYSAGGHLSTLVSVARNNVSDWNPAVTLRGGVDFYGITDLRRWTKVNAQWFNDTGIFNDTVLDDYTIVDPFSPITYVNSSLNDVSDIVPILILHGTADSVVDISQSREFNAKCDARGVKCTLIEVPKAEHVFEGQEDYFGGQLSLWAMERFFQLCLSS